MRPLQLLLLLTLMLLIAATAFTGRFRDNPDRLDELSACLSGFRGKLDKKTAIGVFSFSPEAEMPGYVCNALVPVPAVQQGLGLDTELFVIPLSGEFPRWDSIRTARQVLDSVSCIGHRLFLTRRAR